MTERPAPGHASRTRRPFTRAAARPAGPSSSAPHPPHPRPGGRNVRSRSLRQNFRDAPHDAVGLPRRLTIGRGGVARSGGCQDQDKVRWISDKPAQPPARITSLKIIRHEERAHCMLGPFQGAC